jgi:hypothetical protein
MAERGRMDPAEADTVTRLKQACLDISNAALALFDQIDEHGTEAPWVGANVLTMKRLAESYDQIRSYFRRPGGDAARRLGVTPDQLAGLAGRGRRSRD